MFANTIGTIIQIVTQNTPPLLHDWITTPGNILLATYTLLLPQFLSALILVTRIYQITQQCVHFFVSENSTTENQEGNYF